MAAFSSSRCESTIITRTRRHQRSASRLTFIRRYLVLHAVDLTIRYKGVTVPYGYIIGTSTNDALRVLAEVLVLAGYWQTMERFKTPRVANLLSRSRNPKVRKHWVMPELLPIGLLWILGLYQVGLQFALCFCWLAFVDLDIINTIARARSAYDVSYVALYFTTLLTMGGLLVFGMPHRDGKTEQAAYGRIPLKYEHLEQVGRAKRSLKNVSFSPLSNIWVRCAS